MSKRYFYTDPLAAAWQAKRHGFRFRNHNNGVEITLADILAHAQTGNICAISLHSDSLGLLEAQAGDCITWEYPPNAVFRQRHLYEVITEGNNHSHFPADAKRLIEEVGAQIILRGGITYMWPESEDA